MDCRVVRCTTLPTPNELATELPLAAEDTLFVATSRREIEQVLAGTDPANRFLVIVGPCSIHDYDAALEYAERLLALRSTHPSLYIVMRVYFEKPRTRGGWKGFLYDPDLDGSCDVAKGLRQGRRLLLELARRRLPVACEFLDTLTPQYLAELVSWGAIGARTVESQVHRQLASGLSMPIGFKNTTDGDYKKAIDGILSASVPHSFLGIDHEGRAAHITTTGNPIGHLILRGGRTPAYDEATCEAVAEDLKKEGIRTGVVIDCSHGNSAKVFLRQILVAITARRLSLVRPELGIRGLMIESNLEEGNQSLAAGCTLRRGVSITDACVSFFDTEVLLGILDTVRLAESLTPPPLTELRSTIDAYDLALATAASLTRSPMPPSRFHRTAHVTEYDEAIYACALAQERATGPCLLVLALRMSLCDAIAEAKFRAAPFSYLLRTADLPTLLTDPRREQLIAASRPDDFTRIMDVSKRIQLKSLQKLIANARIGYLFGIGTFSHEAVSEFFNGQHTPYPSVEDLYAAVRSGDIDHALVPIYNNNIGTIFEPPAEFQTVGQVQKRITLSVFTNSTNALPSNMPYHTLFVERHVYAEAQEALQSRFLYRNLQFVPSSRDGTVEVAKQREPCLTVASSNIQGLLYELAHNIVPYNFTTFSLITNR